MTNKGKSSHVGSALSCVDILSILYTKIIDVEKIKSDSIDRDRFVMSKGHAGAALYAVLSEIEIIDKNILMTHYQNGSNLSGHVSHKLLDGIEVSTGSLGHGLPISIGMAYGLKINKSKSHVFCLMSDGELDEGSNWEAFLFGSHHQLSNLTAIIDRNNLQSITSTEKTLGLEPLDQKLKYFGWEVIIVDGHSHKELESQIKLTKSSNKPSIIIASTKKGKGVSFMEDSVLWHYKSPNQIELFNALKEIKDEE
tara:strand:- start:56 stop:814 length:759 start_codon:yes stop_codon:yes gene_type:complete